MSKSLCPPSTTLFRSTSNIYMPQAHVNTATTLDDSIYYPHHYRNPTRVYTATNYRTYKYHFNERETSALRASSLFVYHLGIPNTFETRPRHTRHSEDLLYPSPWTLLRTLLPSPPRPPRHVCRTPSRGWRTHLPDVHAEAPNPKLPDALSDRRRPPPPRPCSPRR